jgi:hypothetical protein
MVDKEGGAGEVGFLGRILFPGAAAKGVPFGCPHVFTTGKIELFLIADFPVFLLCFSL